MAPRRSSRVVGTVVKTTTQIVEQTVQVSVVKQYQEQQEETQTRTRTRTRARSVDVESLTVEPSVDEESIKETIIIPVSDSTPKNTNDSSTSQSKGNDAGEDQKSKTRGRRRKGKRKVSGGGGGGGGGGYKRYVYRVLKQVHPKMGISGEAMVIVNNMMSDMFERLAEEAKKLSKYTGGVTLSWREIEGAVRLVLAGELGKHAIAEGIKAVNAYVSYKSDTLYSGVEGR